MDIPSAQNDRIKLRLIPISSVSGTDMLLGFIPEKIEIDGSPVDAVVALDTKCDKYDGCDGIIPISLIYT